MSKSPAPALTFAGNLSRLMADRNLSQNELSKRSGVGQTTLSQILNSQAPQRNNPRCSTIQQIAEFFGVPAWLMFIPEVPLDLIDSDRIAVLIQHYTSAAASGRRVIDQVAEAQAHYQSGPE